MRSVFGRRLRVLCELTSVCIYCSDLADESRHSIVVGLVKSPYPTFSLHIRASTRLRFDGRLPHHYAPLPVQLFDIVSRLGRQILLFRTR